MLKWQENFLAGESVKNPEKIKKKLNSGKPVLGIYLLTLAENPVNLMDIIPAAMLIQKSFYGICPKIIGMAKGKEEALEMVRSLIDEMYRETGTFPFSCTCSGLIVSALFFYARHTAGANSSEVWLCGAETK